jgi:uncharacterized protein YdeI (BOF family)
MKPLRQGILYWLVGLAVLWGAPQVSAQAQWKEKMTLSFSEPVRVPGKVLPAGKYMFKLAPSQSNRNIVQIYDEGERELLATTMTVPKKREEAKGDVVLTFGAAAAGAPPALQAYFYPGTIYGHEFVYPEQEARELAARHRTLVVSHDVKGADDETATLRIFNDRGESRDFVAHTSSPGDMTEPDAKAPMVMTDRQGENVSLDTLEENASKYIGQRISVDAEVEEIYGPRLFTIDEPNWGDLDGEVLVFMPSILAALVAEGDRVTISGTMRPFMKAEIEREWGWLETTPEIEADFSVRPVLVAERVVGGQGDLAMRITTEPSPVGTSGGSAAGKTATTASGGKSPALNSVADVATASDEAIGRTVDLNGVTVDEVQKDGGFWVRDARGNRAFVLPQDHHNNMMKVSKGQNISIDGITLAMPDGMRDRLNTGPGGQADLYVFATSVTR